MKNRKDLLALIGLLILITLFSFFYLYLKPALSQTTQKYTVFKTENEGFLFERKSGNNWLYAPIFVGRAVIYSSDRGDKLTVIGDTRSGNYFRYVRSMSIKNYSSKSFSNHAFFIDLDTKSLISAGKMRRDCGDIAVTDSDGKTLLPYWVRAESCNARHTPIGIKIPFLPANSEKLIYIYYGNPGATYWGNKKELLPLQDGSLSFPGWSNNLTSICGVRRMMGGYGIPGNYTQKTIYLPKGEYTILFWFVIGDTWDGEYFQLYLNDKLVWSEQFWGQAGESSCGKDGWADILYARSVDFSHEGGNLTIIFTSTLNQDATDEWWGIEYVAIYPRLLTYSEIGTVSLSPESELSYPAYINPTLFVDSVRGMVGVGTEKPKAKLEVTGNIAVWLNNRRLVLKFMNLGEDIYGEYISTYLPISDTCNGDDFNPYICDPSEQRTCNDVYGKTYYYQNVRVVTCKLAAAFVEE